MCKCLVGFCHSVSILTPLDGASSILCCIQDLCCQPVRERLARAAPRRTQQPAHGQRIATSRRHLYGHLVGRPTHAPRLDLDHRTRIADGLLKHLEWLPSGASLYLLKSVIHQPCGRALFASLHDDVDKRRQLAARITSIRANVPASGPIASRHSRSSSDTTCSCGAIPRLGAETHLGFFVPYCDRPRARPSTPEASSAPRTMW